MAKHVLLYAHMFCHTVRLLIIESLVPAGINAADRSALAHIICTDAQRTEHGTSSYCCHHLLLVTCSGETRYFYFTET